MGRHKKPISDEQWEQMGQYALNGCQNGTIAALMGWDKQFIDERPDILTYLHEKRAERKNKLYEAQYTKAVNQKDSTMLIWLGKNCLDQTDKQENKVDAQINITINDGCV